MFNESSFSFFLTYTFSNKPLHLLLILFEYFGFIFPSILQSCIKIHHYNKTLSEYLPSTQYLHYFFLPRYLHQSSSTSLQIGVFFIVFLIILCYYFILLYGIPKHKCFFIPFALLINIIDLNAFRYLSLFPMDIFLWLFILFYHLNSFFYNLLSFVFLILFFIFIFTSFYYIKYNAVIINISNPQLVDQPKSYPYDHFSSSYQIQFLILKALIAIEYNYFISCIRINSIVVALNACIIMMSFFIFYDYSLKNAMLKFNWSLFYVNIEQNYLRNIIIIFNFYLCVLAMCLCDYEGKGESLWMMVIIAVNLMVVTMYLQHKYLFQYLVYQQQISYELLLLMILSDVKRKSILFDYDRLLDSSYMNHTSVCKERGRKCLMCTGYSKDYQGNIHLMFRFLKKESVKGSDKDDNGIFEKIAKLLYYKMTLKSVKLFRFYYALIYKYKKKNEAVVKTIRALVENWLIKENNDQISFIENILKVKKLERETKDYLTSLSEYFNLNLLLKKPHQVIELSSRVYKIISDYKNIMTINSQLHGSSSHLLENSQKNLTGALTYSMHIIRFIIESLINHEIIDLPIVNLDNLDEFLNLHYTSDHLLICLIDLKESQYEQNAHIVKITGELSKCSYSKEYLSDLYPQEITQDGIKLFNKEINNTSTKEKVFKFPFIIKGLIEKLRYSFYIIPTLQNQCIMLFGQYYKEKSKCLLLQLNKQITIVSFSKEMLKLLKLKRRWINYLKTVQFQFDLNVIFKRVTIRDITNHEGLECELDYAHFIKASEYIFTELKSLQVFSADQTNLFHLESTMEMLKNSIGLSIVIHMDKIASYSDGISLYKIKVKNKYSTSITPNDHNHTKPTENNDNQFNHLLANTIQSSTFSGDYSQTSISISAKNKSTQFQLLTNGLRTQIKVHTKRLSFFTAIMILFNVILVFLSVMFLYIQITSSNNMIGLNDLFFKFKSIQISVSNIIIELIATSCFTMDKDALTCSNPLRKFSKYFLELHSLDESLSLLDYFTNEMYHKGLYTLTLLTEFRGFLFSSANTKFVSFLDEAIEYYLIEEHSDFRPVIVKKNNTFEDSLRIYINTVFLLSSHDIGYEDEPLYILDYNNGEYSFKNIPGRLSIVQKELYLGLLNYINFYHSFEAAEREIKTEIKYQTAFIQTNNIAFMVVIAVLNLLLLVFCCLNINLAYRLYKILIIHVMEQLENKECLSKLNKKTDVLLLMVKLYDKNPNDLIRKIKGSIIPRMSIDKQNIPTKKAKEVLGTHYNPFNNKEKISFGYEFFSFILNNILRLILGIFFIFFVITIVFDYVISVNYIKLDHVFDYLTLHYSFENSIYSNLAFITLSHVGNISDGDLANLIKMNNTKDGIINSLILSNLETMQYLIAFTKINTGTYLLMKDSFNTTCDTIFKGFTDPFLSKISLMLDKEYIQVSEKVCNVYNSLSLDNFFYMNSDTIDRIHKVANKRMTKDYTSLSLFLNDFELVELYTIIMFVFRPIVFSFRWNTLIPMISYNFSSYVVLIGIYLAITIVLEMVIFAIVKWVVIQRLNFLQENLFLFNNCIK